MTFVCCQVEVSATGRSLIRSSPTECGVSECDREALVKSKLWPTAGCCAKKARNALRVFVFTLLERTMLDPEGFSSLLIFSNWPRN